MALGTKAGVTSSILVLVAFAVAGAGNLKAVVSLEQVTERRPGDFAPVMEGEVVAVVGTVSAKPMPYPLFAHLAIQDEYGHALLLEGILSQFTRLQPGLRVEAKGTVSKRAGVPVLLVSHIEAISRGSAPAPRKVSLPDMHSFRESACLCPWKAAWSIRATTHKATIC